MHMSCLQKVMYSLPCTEFQVSMHDVSLANRVWKE